MTKSRKIVINDCKINMLLNHLPTQSFLDQAILKWVLYQLYDTDHYQFGKGFSALSECINALSMSLIPCSNNEGYHTLYSKITHIFSRILNIL